MTKNSCIPDKDKSEETVIDTLTDTDTETPETPEVVLNETENVIVIPIPKKARKKSIGWTKPRYNLFIMEKGNKIHKGMFCSYKQIADFLSAFNQEYEGMKPGVVKYIHNSTEKKKRYRNVIVEKYIQPAPEPVINPVN